MTTYAEAQGSYATGVKMGLEDAIAEFNNFDIKATFDAAAQGNALLQWQVGK
jgi:hypothetical protein